MNKEVYKEMCSQIYEGESWDRMINCLERKDKEIEIVSNELQVQMEDNTRLNEYIEEQETNIKEANVEIEKLTAESTEWESKCYNYQDTIKEVREELKILKELEDFSIVKLQLTNIVFRLDKEN